MSDKYFPFADKDIELAQETYDYSGVNEGMRDRFRKQNKENARLELELVKRRRRTEELEAELTAALETYKKAESYFSEGLYSCHEKNGQLEAELEETRAELESISDACSSLINGLDSYPPSLGQKWLVESEDIENIQKELNK